MAKLKDLEALYERYNYKQMDKEELYDLISKLLNDRDIFAHFYLYEVDRDVLPLDK